MAPASRVIDQVQQALGKNLMTDHAMLHRHIVSAAIKGIREDLRHMTKGSDPAYVVSNTYAMDSVGGVSGQ